MLRYFSRRFSLRTLLICVTVICIGTFLANGYWRRVQQQRAAVAFVQSLGNSNIYYDYEYERRSDGKLLLSKRLSDPAPSIGVKWFPWLGVDGFHHVIALIVRIDASQIALISRDVLWRHLNQLSHLKSIEVPEVMVTAEHLRSFSGRDQVEELQLMDANATDELLRSCFEIAFLVRNS